MDTVPTISSFQFQRLSKVAFWVLKLTFCTHKWKRNGKRPRWHLNDARWFVYYSPKLNLKRWSKWNYGVSYDQVVNMGVSKNRGTPKCMIYNGNPYRNGWFGGTTIFGNTHINSYIPDSETRSIFCWESIPGPKSSSRHRYFLKREGYQHVPWEKNGEDMGNTWGKFMKMWKWYHKAIKSWVYVRGTWVSRGGIANHDFIGIRWCSSKQLPFVLEKPFSHNHGSVENWDPKWKGKRSYWRYCTPIFHWTMIMGGRVVTHVTIKSPGCFEHIKQVTCSASTFFLRQQVAGVYLHLLPLRNSNDPVR